MISLQINNLGTMIMYSVMNPTILSQATTSHWEFSLVSFSFLLLQYIITVCFSISTHSFNFHSCLSVSRKIKRIVHEKMWILKSDSVPLVWLQKWKIEASLWEIFMVNIVIINDYVMEWLLDTYGDRIHLSDCLWKWWTFFIYKWVFMGTELQTSPKCNNHMIYGSTELLAGETLLTFEISCAKKSSFNMKWK